MFLPYSQTNIRNIFFLNLLIGVIGFLLLKRTMVHIHNLQKYYKKYEKSSIYKFTETSEELKTLDNPVFGTIPNSLLNNDKLKFPQTF